MKLSELDYVEQFQAFNFLEKLAELANGDVRKKIQFDEVWQAIEDNNSNHPMTEDTFENILIPILIHDNLVHQDNNN